MLGLLVGMRWQLLRCRVDSVVMLVVMLARSNESGLYDIEKLISEFGTMIFSQD